MKDFIHHAYAIERGYAYLYKITKEDILNFYKELDYIYTLLEEIGVVHIYSKHDLLAEFEVRTGTFGHVYIESGSNSVEIDIEKLKDSIVGHFVN